MLPNAPTAASGVRKLGILGLVEQHARPGDRVVAHPARQQRLADRALEIDQHLRHLRAIDACAWRKYHQHAVDAGVGTCGFDGGAKVLGGRLPRRARSGRSARPAPATSGSGRRPTAATAGPGRGGFRFTQSAASTPGPPPLVTMARRRPTGRYREARHFAAENSSTKERTRTAPARRSAASNTSSLPTMAPLCVCAALLPAGRRPAFNTTTGLALAAERSALMKLRALEMPSR